MEIYWKALGGLLIAVVLGMVLEKDMTVMLSLAICAMGVAIAADYLRPILTAMKQMEQAANFQGESFQILMKIMGISMIAEIIGMICADAGSASMGKVLKLLTCSAILWLAVPLFQSVLNLIQQILGEL